MQAWSLWNEGQSLQLVDESISYSLQTNEVVKCIKLGLLCVQEHHEDRPLMSAVVLMLSDEHPSFREPKQPGFVARRVPSEASTSSSSNMHEISISMFEPR